MEFVGEVRCEGELREGVVGAGAIVLGSHDLAFPNSSARSPSRNLFAALELSSPACIWTRMLETDSQGTRTVGRMGLWGDFGARTEVLNGNRRENPSFAMEERLTVAERPRRFGAVLSTFGFGLWARVGERGRPA